jgi:hypothetical protein
MKSGILLLILLVLSGLAIALGASAPLRSPAGNQRVTNPSSFSEEFLAHLTDVQEAADSLVAIGDRRERNLLVVGQGQAAMNAALDATDAWLAEQTTSQEDAAIAAYRSGAAAIRQAMTDAQAAFLRFDWDGVAAANATLKQGTAQIADARDLLTAPD